MLLLSVTSHSPGLSSAWEFPELAKHQRETGRQKPSTDSSALLQAGQTPLFKNIQSLPNDRPASHWGKALSPAPGDVTLPSGSSPRIHTKIGAFLLLPFLQGLPYGKQDVFLYFEKIAAIALILLASPTLLFPLWMIYRGYLWICTRCLQHHCSPFVYKGYLCSPLDEELLFQPLDQSLTCQIVTFGQYREMFFNIPYCNSWDWFGLVCF